MGGSGSKAARSAAGSAARKYPSRPSTHAPPTSNSSAAPANSRTSPSAGPSVHPMPQASSTRSETIDLDARDPEFANRLSKLGPVKPAPTFSPSSTVQLPAASSTSPRDGPVYPSAATSPAMTVIASRQRIQEAAEQERIDSGRKGFAGKQFLDISTIKKALALRDERGMNPAQIEESLGLKNGVMSKLGRVGIVEVA